MRGILVLFILLSFNTLLSKDYYVYVAAESDDMVSLLKFDGKELVEVQRFEVGVMPTEIEGPHGITVDPNGKYWYLSLESKVLKLNKINKTKIPRISLGTD